MTLTADAPTTLDTDATAFVDAKVAEATHVFDAFRRTGSLTAYGTFVIWERIPGLDATVQVSNPSPLVHDQSVTPVVRTFDGQDLLDPTAPSAGPGWSAVFVEHPEVTTLVHVHTPYLGAWAQTQQALPIRYAAVQRWTLARSIPVHVDRTTGQEQFILDTIAADPETPGILEGNGGATVWGRKGLLATAETILLLEELAQLQLLAQAAGGSREFGPGTLEQQWSLTGLADRAREQGLLPAAS